MLSLFGEGKAQKELAALAELLHPILVPHGFKFFPGETGVSSGGGFANGSFRRSTDELGLGLIYRGSQLGCPNYELGRFGAGHHELMHELGRVDDCALWFDDALDKWCLFVRHGPSVTGALVADLTRIILPCLSQTPEIYRGALERAIIKRMDGLTGSE